MCVCVFPMCVCVCVCSATFSSFFFDILKTFGSMHFSCLHFVTPFLSFVWCKNIIYFLLQKVTLVVVVAVVVVGVVVTAAAVVSVWCCCLTFDLFPLVSCFFSFVCFATLF